MQNITVRTSRPGDEVALSRLAALDSARPLRGPALIAEAGERMLAALPLGSGRPVADPFEPTAELVALLELRRSQIASAPQFSRRIRSLVRGRLHHAEGLRLSQGLQPSPLAKRRLLRRRFALGTAPLRQRRPRRLRPPSRPTRWTRASRSSALDSGVGGSSSSRPGSDTISSGRSTARPSTSSTQ